jgi:hypothetical protein
LGSVFLGAMYCFLGGCLGEYSFDTNLIYFLELFYMHLHVGSGTRRF